MLSKLQVVFMVALVVIASSCPCGAEGEGILATTGEYTFFIKPHPSSCITYYQKLVPCVAKETVPVPKPVLPAYQVPVPDRRQIPVTVSEAPVGCAIGSGPCVTCTARPSCGPGTKDVWGPKPVNVRVPETLYEPRCVSTPVMLPQWFAVTEQPNPPKMPRKVVHKVSAGG